MLEFIYGNFKDTEQNLEKVSRLAPCDGIQKKIKWCFSSKILKKRVKVKSFDSWLLIGSLDLSLTNQELGFKGLHFDPLFLYL